MTRKERALKSLKQMCSDGRYLGSGSYAPLEVLEDFSTAIKALEQEPRWIPTSERLPKEDGEYCATIYDTDENYKYMDIAELEDGIWQYKDYIKVLAWMPLPKAYKEVEE